MTELSELSWRAYPAALLIAVGLASAVWSAYRGVSRARRLRDPGRALAIMQGFRIAIGGLAVAAIGAAWWWQIGWLFGLALVIGGQELLESTVVITALKNAPLASGQLEAPGQGDDGTTVASAPPASYVRRFYPSIPSGADGAAPSRSCSDAVAYSIPTSAPPARRQQMAQPAAASQRAIVVSRSGGPGMA